MNKAVFGRLVIFAPVIIVFTANGRSIVINGAGATGQNMFTASLNQQIPAAVILVELDMLMRYLPEQVTKIIF